MPFLNDSVILSGGKDRTVIAWNAQTGQALFLLDGHQNSGKIVEEALVM